MALRANIRGQQKQQALVHDHPLPPPLFLGSNMDAEQKPKWTFNTSVEVSTDADKVWSIFADFFGLQKWIPYLKECSPVEGISGEPGCVRYCELHSNGGPIIKWVKERLVSIDHARRSYSYSIIDNNVGYGSYVGTMTVIPRADGCKIEWSVVADPVEELTHEGMAAFLDALLGAMAKTIQEAHSN